MRSRRANYIGGGTELWVPIKLIGEGEESKSSGPRNQFPCQLIFAWT